MIFGEPDSNVPGVPPQNNPQQVQLRFDVSKMEDVYANFFAVGSGQDELIVYIGNSAPIPGVKEQVMRVSHRVMLLPANAKRLMIALQQTVKAYEDRFGPIEIPPPPQPPRGAKG